MAFAESNTAKRTSIATSTEQTHPGQQTVTGVIAGDAASTRRPGHVARSAVVAMTAATTLMIMGFTQYPNNTGNPRPVVTPTVSIATDLTFASLHVHHTRIVESFVTDDKRWRALSATPLATLRANVSTHPSYRRVVLDLPATVAPSAPSSVKPMFEFRGVGFPQIETTVAASEAAYKPYRDLVDVVATTNGVKRAIPQVACHGMSAKRTLRKSSVYDDKIKALSARYNVSAYLVKAVMAQESCFRPNARSYVGATGLMQLMPETAAWLGVKDIHNTDENLRAGVRYLAQLKRRFKQDDLALAAYNAGPGTVERHGGIPPFPETQTYVKNVRFYKLAYMTADRMNLSQKLDEDPIVQATSAAAPVAATTTQSRLAAERNS